MLYALDDCIDLSQKRSHYLYWDMFAEVGNCSIHIKIFFNILSSLTGRPNSNSEKNLYQGSFSKSMSSGFMRSGWSSCEGKGKEKAHTERRATNAASLQQYTCKHKTNIGEVME